MSGGAMIAWPYYARVRVELTCGHVYLGTAGADMFAGELCAIGMWCDECNGHCDIRMIMKSGWAKT